MMNSHKILSRITLILSVLFLLFTSSATPQEIVHIRKKTVKIDFNDVIPTASHGLQVNDHPALRIAVAAMISPKETYQSYIDLINMVGHFMDQKVIFIQKKTYSEVNDMLKNKELDLAFVCSGPYVSGKEEFGMELLVVPVCHGKKVYHSYFITSTKNGNDSFESLRGKTFAFTDPLSNTGYLVPIYYLAKRGETEKSFFAKTFFTHGHDNSIKAVAEGLADGAAVDSLIYDYLKSVNPEMTAKTMIIEKSPPYGIPPVVTLSSMAPQTKEKLRNIFLSIHENPQGRKILEQLRIERFERGNDKDYDTVRELQNFLKERGL